MILVDTNVIVDVIGRDPVWVDWSRQQLNAAAATDRLAINEVVYAELCAGYDRLRAVDALLASADLALVRTPRSALFLAGKAFRRYRQTGGPRTGVLPDFFIGAHALVDSVRLLTRDARLYRTYFPGIELITPDLN
jgi:predicted nucleic acid-binding protein